MNLRFEAGRRKSQRLNIPLRVKYAADPQGHGLVGPVVADNISGRGMSFTLEEPLRKDEKLRMLIYFPDDPKPIGSVSRVVWCKKDDREKRPCFKVGIQHLRIDPDDRERFVFEFCETMVNYFTATPHAVVS